MADDFYCDEVLNGKTSVRKVIETENVLAFHHTMPYWPVHIVVVPKRHIVSILALNASDDVLVLEMISVIKQVAQQVMDEYGQCRVITNLGHYQDSRHLHWHVSSGSPLR